MGTTKTKRIYGEAYEVALPSGGTPIVREFVDVDVNVRGRFWWLFGWDGYGWWGRSVIVALATVWLLTFSSLIAAGDWDGLVRSASFVLFGFASYGMGRDAGAVDGITLAERFNDALVKVGVQREVKND